MNTGEVDSMAEADVWRMARRLVRLTSLTQIPLMILFEALQASLAGTLAYVLEIDDFATGCSRQRSALYGSLRDLLNQYFVWPVDVKRVVRPVLA